MSKRIEKDGKFYRERKGKLVEIPPEWVGRVFHRCSHCKHVKTHQKAESTKEKNEQTKDLRQQMAEYRNGG